MRAEIAPNLKGRAMVYATTPLLVPDRARHIGAPSSLLPLREMVARTSCAPDEGSASANPTARDGRAERTPHRSRRYATADAKHRRSKDGGQRSPMPPSPARGE